MKPLKIGKLYSCSNYFLLLYPDKESTAAAAANLTSVRTAAAYAPVAASAAAYWSKRFGKHVSYWNTETPLLVLFADKEYVEVLAGDRKGWIINEGWLEIKEIVDEAA